MNRELFYTIPLEYDNTKVEFFLKSQGFSHSILVALKKTPFGISRNGTWLYTNDILHSKDKLRILIIEQEDQNQILPIPIPIEIVYEDEDILLVNKPSGMPVHPSIANYDNTLANAVTFYFKQKGIPFVFRCLNRLDKDTTGILVIAKNSLSSAILSSAMKKKEIKREYLCIVTGIPPESGTISAAIARKEGSILERIVDPDSKETAVTHFNRICTHEGMSLLRVSLETGRTHQIRVHMKYIGHPLPGDFLYNPDFSKIKRQSLHSARLSFQHPITKKPLTFYAPLPQDMRQLMPNFDFDKWIGRENH